MKTFLMGIAVVVMANPASAQLGKIMKGVDTAQQIRELNISEKDERALGEAVSDRVRLEFGVFQDKEVTKYVTLVGTVMTQASSRPDLNWEFIVLDTDGVNAFASPGGIVHITRGALGLIKSEAELAGVLAHEISHITKKHTVNSIRNNKGFKMASDAAPGSGAYVGALANAAYDNIVEKGFDRGDEEDADQEGIRLANKVGYNPAGLATFLEKLNARNKGVATRNALFASHPETEGRISKLGQQIKSQKLAATAMAESRYAGAIKFDAKPITEISDGCGRCTRPGRRFGLVGQRQKRKRRRKRQRKKGSAWVDSGSPRANRRNLRRRPLPPATAPWALIATPRAAATPRR